MRLLINIMNPELRDMQIKVLGDSAKTEISLFRLLRKNYYKDNKVCDFSVGALLAAPQLGKASLAPTIIKNTGRAPPFQSCPDAFLSHSNEFRWEYPAGFSQWQQVPTCVFQGSRNPPNIL